MICEGGGGAGSEPHIATGAHVGFLDGNPGGTGGWLWLTEGGPWRDGNEGTVCIFVIGTGDMVGTMRKTGRPLLPLAPAGIGPDVAGGNVSMPWPSTAHTCLIAVLVKFATCPIAFEQTLSCWQPILKTLKDVQQKLEMHTTFIISPPLRQQRLADAQCTKSWHISTITEDGVLGATDDGAGVPMIMLLHSRSTSRWCALNRLSELAHCVS